MPKDSLPRQGGVYRTVTQSALLQEERQGRFHSHLVVPNGVVHPQAVESSAFGYLADKRAAGFRPAPSAASPQARLG
jgi:hypothetical protein